MYTEQSKSNRAPELEQLLGQARATIGYGAVYNYKGRPPKSRKSVFQISNVPNTAGFGCNLCAPLFGNKADLFCRAAICTVPSQLIRPCPLIRCSRNVH